MHLFFLVLIRDLEDEYYALFRKLRCGGRNSDIQNGKMYRRQNTYWMDQDIKEGIEVLAQSGNVLHALERIMPSKMMTTYWDVLNIYGAIDCPSG